MGPQWYDTAVSSACCHTFISVTFSLCSVPQEYCSVLLWWARSSSLTGPSHKCKKWHQLNPALESWSRETAGEENNFVQSHQCKLGSVKWQESLWMFLKKNKIKKNSKQFHDGLDAHMCRLLSGSVDLSCAPGWSHCHNTIQASLCVRQNSAHLLVSPRQQHTGVLAESLISIFYEGTQRQALEYLPRRSAAYYINYSVSR